MEIWILKSEKNFREHLNAYLLTDQFLIYVKTLFKLKETGRSFYRFYI